MQLSPLPILSASAPPDSSTPLDTASDLDSGSDFMSTMANELGIEPGTPEYDQFIEQTPDAAKFLRSRGMSFADVDAIIDHDVINEALTGLDSELSSEESDDPVDDDAVALFADFIQFLQGLQNPASSSESEGDGALTELDSETAVLAEGLQQASTLEEDGGTVVSSLPDKAASRMASPAISKTETPPPSDDNLLTDTELEPLAVDDGGNDNTGNVDGSSTDEADLSVAGGADNPDDDQRAVAMNPMATAKPVVNDPDGSAAVEPESEADGDGLKVDADTVGESSSKQAEKMVSVAEKSATTADKDSDQKSFDDTMDMVNTREQSKVKQEQAQVQKSVEIPLKQPVTHSEWAKSVNDRILMMANRHIQVAHIRLDPPDLGSLEIKLSVNSDQQAQVTIVTQHAQVKELLDANMARLRTMMQEQNIELVDAQVSDQSGRGQFSGEQQSQGGYGDGEFDGEDEESLSVTPAFISQALLDHYV